MKASFNICNNRLKLYPLDAPRLSPEENEKRRVLGFVWWPGQKCFTAIWSPQAEDWVSSYAPIEEEDEPDDIESRVSRYSNYSDKAEANADAAASRVLNATTERRARLSENVARNEIEKAEYWAHRIAGAIRHAQHHDNPQTCANRVKGLQADFRKFMRTRDDHALLLAQWKCFKHPEEAKIIANHDHISQRFLKSEYPNSTYEGDQSLWSALDDHTITPEQARAIAIPYHTQGFEYCSRWLEHLQIRLDYEKAYLEALDGSKLLDPKPRRKPAPAPTDGLKKGDKVTYPWGWAHNEVATGQILSMGAKTVRVSVPAEKDIYGRYKKGYQIPRRYVKKVTDETK